MSKTLIPPAATAAAVTMLAAAVFATAASAQTIYPLDRAEILSGARFDFKVELPASIKREDATITINGEPLADTFSKPEQFITSEEGLPLNALWIKDASIQKPGKYVVEAKAGDNSTKVTWEVFGTPERRAKNVILFIGDGVSVAHRTVRRRPADRHGAWLRTLPRPLGEHQGVPLYRAGAWAGQVAGRAMPELVTATNCCAGCAAG